MGINNILRCKRGSELEVLSNSENLLKVQDKVQHIIKSRNTSIYDCNSFDASGKHFRNSNKYASCNRITESKIGLKEMKKPFTG